MQSLGRATRKGMFPGAAGEPALPSIVPLSCATCRRLGPKGFLSLRSGPRSPSSNARDMRDRDCRPSGQIYPTVSDTVAEDQADGPFWPGGLGDWQRPAAAQ